MLQSLGRPKIIINQNDCVDNYYKYFDEHCHYDCSSGNIRVLSTLLSSFMGKMKAQRAIYAK